ncbi:NAD(P)H-binding protein [Gluconacetobacter entanii]|uniref:NADH-ubiquinone oxidoreductase n=1 Tax=Gluconacetobacter entanii TaxID=108528 RepID=A0A318PVV2_9PROT|nr:NADH-ubiquinone oxidoreductase [Gluconacetobacter entanii]PYD64329.1 NADH-ubiquinone oxidoreductase [Gluconacetobacter entanii]
MRPPPVPHAPVHVIGASGRSGRALCAALLRAGVPYVPLVRDVARWRATGLPGVARRLDLTDPPSAVASALQDARRIVSTAHARHVGAIVAAAPPAASLVCLGSTRMFTRWPDAHGMGVAQGQQALLSSGRDGVMLHPTMIYGAQGENNIRRLLGLIRRLPVLPLPSGGRALVQPIFQDDVTSAIMAALGREWQGGHALVIAGGQAVAYHELVALVARHAGLRRRPVLDVPASVLMGLCRVTSRLPGLPRVTPAEIRRLTEDKAFDITPMRAALGFTPRTPDEGLRQFLGASQ